MFSKKVIDRLENAEKEILRLKDEIKRLTCALEQGSAQKGVSCAFIIDEWINGKEGENDR